MFVRQHDFLSTYHAMQHYFFFPQRPEQKLQWRETQYLVPACCFAAMQPDGNCLYRAVEDQLREARLSGDAAAAAADVPAFEQLRAAAVDYIRGHEDEFAPFVLPVRGAPVPFLHGYRPAVAARSCFVLPPRRAAVTQHPW